jgi:outer membrane protein assembly factor BamB
MKNRLVAFGGGLGVILFLACAGNDIRLNITPNPQNMYAGYKGGPARTGFVNAPEADTLADFWKIKFRYPLNYSPSLAGNHLFQPGNDKKIHVIDLNTGQETAEIKLRRPIACSPELADSFLVICEELEGDNLLVINYLTGKLVWKNKVLHPNNPPALYENKIFWVNSKKSLIASNLTDGGKIWSVELTKKLDGGLVAANQSIIIACEDSSMICYNAANGNLKWRQKLPSRLNSSPACSDGQIFLCLGDGQILCNNLENGDLIWKTTDKPRLFFSPAIDSTGLYYGNGDGHLVKLDKRSGEKLWEFVTETPIRGTALVTTNAVIFGSLDHHVYLLGKEDGHLIASFATGGMISAAPAIIDNKLFIAARDKYLYCFLLTGE